MVQKIHIPAVNDLIRDIHFNNYIDIIPIRSSFYGEVTTTWATLWEGSGIYPWQTVKSIIKLSSTDANDTSAGTGARTIKIKGMSDAYDLQEEIVTLNGLTEVLTTLEYYRVFSIEVMTVGSGETAAGTIYAGFGTVTAGVPATILSLITNGVSRHNQSKAAIFTVPAGYILILCDYVLSVGKGKDVQFHLFERKLGEPFKVFEDFDLYQQSLSVSNFLANKWDEKTDLEIRTKTSAGTIDASGSFGYFLVKKSTYGIE